MFSPFPGFFLRDALSWEGFLNTSPFPLSFYASSLAPWKNQCRTNSTEADGELAARVMKLPRGESSTAMDLLFLLPGGYPQRDTAAGTHGT